MRETVALLSHLHGVQWKQMNEHSYLKLNNCIQGLACLPTPSHSWY